MDPTTLILTQTVMAAAPLLLAGYGELLAQRAGIINVGIEGAMLLGAFTAFAAATLTGSLAAALLAALLAGMLLAAIFAFATVWCRADQIVSGTALNILAFGLQEIGWQSLQRHIQPATPYFETVPIPLLHKIPIIGPAFFHQYALFYIVIALALPLYLFMTRTRQGIILRSLGDAPDAAHAAGMRVNLRRTLILLIAGAASGIAGAYFTTMRNHSFHLNMIDGQGFLILALVIFGRWSIPGLLLGTFAFALLDALQSDLATRLPVSTHLFKMLPYVATLAGLAFLRKSKAGPLKLGLPWPE